MKRQQGPRFVTAAQLSNQRPERPSEWDPLSHRRVYELSKEALAKTAYSVTDETLTLMRNDEVFFAVFDTNVVVIPGVTMAVGVKTATSKALYGETYYGFRVRPPGGLWLGENIVNVWYDKPESEARLEACLTKLAGQLDLGLHAWAVRLIGKIIDFQIEEEPEDNLARMVEERRIPRTAVPAILTGSDKTGSSITRRR